MPDPTSVREPLELLADEFLARYRCGERLSISDYASQHPELAAEIRDLFPTLVVMEQAVTGSQEAQTSLTSGSSRGAVRIGEFRIIRTLGRGGMGVVYEAEQESLGRRVALKVLPLHALLTPNQLLRFRREARAAAALHHNHIVPVFSVGQGEGVHYYAMQFIEGDSLDRVIAQMEQVRRLESGAKQRSPLTDRETEPINRPEDLPSPRASGLGAEQDSPAVQQTVSCRLDDTQPTPVYSSASWLRGKMDEHFHRVASLGLQAAEALAYAHSQGIVHRDIKPSNLILDHQGQVWVTDFGVAQISGDLGMTNTGDLVGTIRYMAPEQLQGWADPRTDVHGLGLVLFELLALRPALDGENRGRLIQQITETMPPPLRRLDARIPRDLETIVAKAMAKDPGDRYLSAGELAADLRRFLADQPVKARRTNSWEYLRRWCRRNPMTTALAATVIGLVLACVGVSMAMNWRLNASLEATTRAERAKTQQLWQSQLNEVLALQQTHRPGQRSESWKILQSAVALTQEANAGEEARRRLRNAAIRTLAQTDLRPRHPGPEDLVGGTVIGFTPLLDRYLRRDGLGNISVRRVNDDREVGTLPSKGFANGDLLAVAGARFSADGRWLALNYLGGKDSDGIDQLVVWDVDQGKAALVVPVKSRLAGSDLSRDGNRLVFASRDGIVQVLDLPEGRTVAKFRLPYAAKEIRLSPRGDRIATGNFAPGADVLVVDAPTGLVLQRLPHKQAAYLAWHPEGSLLAVTNNDFDIQVWNLAAGREQAVLRGHQALPHDPMFSPDGQLLMSSTYDGTVRLWNPWTGEELVRAAGTMGSVLSDDGRLAMIRQGAKYLLCEVQRSEEYSYLPVGPLTAANRFQASPGTPHPHRDWLPLGGSEGVRLLEIHTGRQLASAAIGHTESPVWSPDGRAMFTVGSAGLRRWKVTESEDAIVLGPPELLGPEGMTVQVHPKGTELTVGTMRGFPFRIDLTQPNSPPLKIDHVSGLATAYSPDGQWFAAGTHHGNGLRVWRKKDNAPAALLFPEVNRIYPQFSPDSRWLAASVDGFVRMWSVGDWRLVRSMETVGGFFPTFGFSPDGRILSYSRSPDEHCLIEVGSGREVLILDAADDLSVGGSRFTRDGSSLLVADSFPPMIRVWRLDKVRQRLEELGLSEDLPAWPAPDLPRNDPRFNAKRVVFDEGLSLDELLQRSETSRQRRLYERACDDLETALNKDPGHASALNRLAWLRSIGPSTVRDAMRAELLARRAGELQPNDPSIERTVAAALIRGNRFDEALVTLARAEQLARERNNGQPGRDELFRQGLAAIAHARLGEIESGRTALQEGRRKLEELRFSLTPTLAFEAESLLAEAAILLDSQ